MPRLLKEKIPGNKRNRGKKDQENFGYKITNNYREALLLDRKDGNTLWDDATRKEMTEL